MTVTIVPFTTDHLAPAATLLAARHQADRTWAPDLSSEYEDPAATLPLLHDLLREDGANRPHHASEGMSGVVAVDHGTVIGYLLGAPAFGSPTRPFAGFRHPRMIEIPSAGHAADPDTAPTIYPRLYVALAEQWVANGFIDHYITVPARPDVLEIWQDLGFSRFIAMNVRPTAAPEAPATRKAADIVVRRATPDDEDVVYELVTEMFRSFAEAPSFVPFLPETARERRQFVADYLADPGSHQWLAVVNDRVVGLQTVDEPTSPLWYQAAIQAPPHAVYLFLGSTLPEARSRGIGAALFMHAMAWAREAGYDTCMLDFLTASRAAPFWRGLGCQTVSYLLRRSVDERAIWGRASP
jgi:GNAT superfamily N-acetyltransferase